FADSGGWGWAAFNYSAASRTSSPGTTADVPPQGNDAKCGFACHTIVKTRDYVFTDYQSRRNAKPESSTLPARLTPGASPGITGGIVASQCKVPVRAATF